MEELVTLVSEKTGLNQAQARQAVDTVLHYLEEKLPISFGAQIASLLSSDEIFGSTDQLVSELTGLFGKKHR
jgi:hypothetical protein